MAKKIYKISDFHGGLDEVSSPVDLKNGFFTNLTDVMVDRIGQIVPMGDFDNAPTHNPTSTNFISHSDPGYGLYAFSSNRRLNGTFTDCIIYVIQQYVSGDEGENFIFWDSEGDSWDNVGTNGDLADDGSGVAILDLQSAALAGQFQPDYLAYSNILRICDGNMANITTPGSITFAHKSYRGWLGYILRTHFPGAAPGGSEDTYAGWYGYESVHPVAPTRGYSSSLAHATCSGSGSTSQITVTGIGAGLDTEMGSDYSRGYIAMSGGGNVASGHTVKRNTDNALTTTTMNATAASEVYRIFPATGLGCVLDLTLGDTGGFLLESEYTFGSTFVYDGHQESSIYTMATGFGDEADKWSIAAGDVGRFYDGSIHLLAPYHPRISGMRIYYQYTEDVDDKWYMAWDVDFLRGSRVNLADDTFLADDNPTNAIPFTRDILQHASDEEAIIHTLPDLLLPGESYESINGYSPKEDIDIRYKTSATVGNLVYVGNVYKKVAGIASHYPDRIWRCALPTYAGTPAVDVFPENFWIANPGINDPIVKLIGMGNQLLAFGMNYLTVYTISAQGESIMGTFKGYGVNKPCHVVSTPNGVAFSNNSGTFIWNGQSVIDLLQKRTG